MSSDYGISSNTVSNSAFIALSAEADRIYAELNLESDIENENNCRSSDLQAEITQERMKNAKLRARVEESENDIRNLRVWCRKVTRSYTELAEKHREYTHIRLELCDKLEQERKAHISTKDVLRNFKAIVTGLDQVACAHVKLVKFEEYH